MFENLKFKFREFSFYIIEPTNKPMKILIGIRTVNTSGSSNDSDGFSTFKISADQTVVLAKGEAEVNRLSPLIKAFKKDLIKLNKKEGESDNDGEGNKYCEVMSWYNQTDKKVALHKKYGREVCNICYGFHLLMITEAEIL